MQVHCRCVPAMVPFLRSPVSPPSARAGVSEILARRRTGQPATRSHPIPRPTAVAAPRGGAFPGMPGDRPAVHPRQPGQQARTNAAIRRRSSTRANRPPTRSINSSNSRSQRSKSTLRPRPSHDHLLTTYLRIIGRWPCHVHGHAPCRHEVSLEY